MSPPAAASPVSYDPKQSKPKDRVRFMLGDTECDGIGTESYLTDDEILRLLTDFGSESNAASQGALRIAAKLARRTDYATGGQKETLSQLFDHYRQLSKDLAAVNDPSGGGAEVFAGGLTLSEKETAAEDTDSIEPQEFREQFTDVDEFQSQPGRRSRE